MDFVANSCRCAAGTARPLFEVADLNFAMTEERAWMLRCGDCGALFPERFPAPWSVGSAYRDYYTTGAPRPAARAWLADRVSSARQAYLIRQTPVTAMRILDYGAGAGAYLSRITALRPEVKAFAADPHRPAGAGGAWTWIGEEEIEAAAPFDWITLGHVVEHLADPGTTLARLARCLAPGGGLWIATPNAESFLFAALGSYARDADFPRHREIFSRKGLTRLLARAGLAARFLPAPRLNAALNAASGLRNLLAARASVLRLGSAARTGWALARHVGEGQARRESASPELIAICEPRLG
ncbi:MAG: class I SAM-dependent methyltransferase [Caulobacteraceae bacterium]